MYISCVPFICHHGQLIPCLKLCLSPGDHLSAFPLQRHQKAVVRPCDLHDRPVLQHRPAHDHELAQHFLTAGIGRFPALRLPAGQDPLEQALIDRLGPEKRRCYVCRHGYDRKGEHLAHRTGHLKEQDDPRDRSPHDGCKKACH